MPSLACIPTMFILPSTSRTASSLLRVRASNLSRHTTKPFSYSSSQLQESSDPQSQHTRPLSKKDQSSQGHAADSNNLHQRDPQSTAANQGKAAKQNTNDGRGLDAASASHSSQTKPVDGGKGNPEGIGMVDQVGSASGSARNFETGEKEEKKK